MNTPPADNVMDPYAAAFPETEPFWAGAAQGRLLLPRCGRCARLHWYPRAHCPFCHAASIGWIEASGRGALYSFSINRKSAAERIIAFVKVEEGPILMTELVGCGFGDARIGMAVRVDFRAAPQGRRVPVFRPVAL